MEQSAWMKSGWKPYLPGATHRISGIGEMAVGVSVFRRSQQNHIPVQGQQRPTLKRSWVGGGDRLKLVRNKDHTYNVVDSVRDEAWYSDLDISIAQPLALLGSQLWDCLDNMEPDLSRLRLWLTKDLAHHERMARHGLDIENQRITGVLDIIHQRIDRQEAKAEELVDRMGRVVLESS